MLNLKFRTLPTIVLVALLAIAVGIAVFFLPLKLMLGAGFGIFLIALSMSHPEVLVAVIILIIPFQAKLPSSLNVGGGLNPFNILVFLLLGFWISQAAIQRRRLLQHHPVVWAILAFSILLVFSMLRSTQTIGMYFLAEEINPAKRWLLPMLLVLPIGFSNFTRHQLQRLIWVVGIALFAMALWCLKDLGQISTAHFSWEYRLSGPFGPGGENDFAAFFVYYAPIFLGLALFEKRSTRKLVYWSLGGITAIAVLFTYSRGAYLGMMTAIIGFGLLKKRWLLALLVILIIGYHLWLPTGVQERVGMTSQKIIEDPGNEIVISPAAFEHRFEKSTAERITIWKGALKMLKDYPFTGVGFSAFQHFITRYAQLANPMDSHNMYLRVACEMGIFGLIGFLLLWLVPELMGIQVYRHAIHPFDKGLALGVVVAILGIAVVNIWGSRFFREELVGLYWVIVGILMRLQFLHQERKNGETNEEKF